MKEEIYTIPVNEAFDADSECPFCVLYKKADKEVTDYVLGPSYMEEDVREETDKLGFCKYHYRKMFKGGNRLGTALMVSTHLKKINKDLASVLKNEENIKSGLFSRNNDSPLAHYIDDIYSSCYACDRIERRMNSYINTFFHLWKKESEFRDKVKSSKGFCLEHFSQIIAEARKRLGGNTQTELCETLFAIEAENLTRLDAELDWFIQKFDYRFADEPWKTSKDSLERTILKISSAQVSDD